MWGCVLKKFPIRAKRTLIMFSILRELVDEDRYLALVMLFKDSRWSFIVFLVMTIVDGLFSSNRHVTLISAAFNLSRTLGKKGLV
jgi:hypothetical protein